MNNLRYTVISIFLSTILLLSTVVTVPHGGGSCTNNYNCSLGGECINSKCVCDPWFTGTSCVYLNLQPAVFPGSGLDYRAQKYYSWGGHCIKDPTDNGTYHGYFSFMCNHQTLSAWTTASSVVHATAKQPEGPYVFQKMVIQPWSHNTIIQRDPLTGTYLLFHIGDAHVDPSKWYPCYTTTSSDVTTKLIFDQSIDHPTIGVTGGDGVYVSTSPTPDGPWTPYNNGNPLTLNTQSWWPTDGISNPTPFIFPNGTTLLMVTGFPCPAGWGNLAPPCIGMMRADHWSGPFFPLQEKPIVHPESEDPFIFQDPRGNFHLLTNVNTYHRRCAAGVPCGGHAWSSDGLVWSDQFIGAFGPRLTTTQGKVLINAYVERPQIYQDPITHVPITFFTGMGVSAYDDSISWAQAFCTKDMDPTKDCGPTI